MTSDLETKSAGTRERILHAAEGLFAEHGFETVSLRDITGAAEANVAAVNYHFGSKDNLIDAVVERHVIPINEERLELLDRFEERYGEEPVPVEEILRAFLLPMLSRIESGAMSEGLFCKFMGRVMGERSYRLPESVEPVFRHTAARFSHSLRRALPEFTEAQALWRMHFSFGVMSNTLTHGDTLRQLAGGRAGDPSMKEQFEHIIIFCAAGIRAGCGAADEKSRKGAQ